MIFRILTLLLLMLAVENHYIAIGYSDFNGCNELDVIANNKVIKIKSVSCSKGSSGRMDHHSVRLKGEITSGIVCTINFDVEYYNYFYDKVMKGESAYTVHQNFCFYAGGDINVYKSSGITLPFVEIKKARYHMMFPGVPGTGYEGKVRIGYFTR
jgi:hypothetical protein